MRKKWKKKKDDVGDTFNNYNISPEVVLDAMIYLMITFLPTD